jgi:zinc D-Ala-D-Ala carboxypeptidase
MTPHFTRAELACRCGCGRMEIPLAEVERLERVRIKCGFPFSITSGYRCPEHNVKVSSTGLEGPHTKAAFDIAVIGNQALDVIRFALEEGFTGIGVKQHGSGRLIHLDALPAAQRQPRPWIWSYP